MKNSKARLIASIIAILLCVSLLGSIIFSAFYSLI